LRFRINGQATITDQGIQLQVDEAYGNSPKYIQKRSMEKASHEASVSHREGEILQQDLVDWILAADTFFVSSSDGGKRSIRLIIRREIMDSTKRGKSRKR